MAWLMHINASMRIYRFILALILPVLLSACIGGIDTGGGGGGGDVGAPTLEIAGVADSQIVLAWTPDPTNPGDTYQLNRDAVAIYTGPDTAYNDLDVINAQNYCYTVSAVTGETVRSSNQVCATPMVGAVLTVTNQSLSALLQWATVPGAVSYNLYFGNPIFSSSLSKTVNKAPGDFGGDPINVTGTSYPMTDLSNNCVTYPVEIRAVDIDGNEGVASTQDVEPDTEGVLDSTFGGGDGYVSIGASGWFADVAVMDDGTILGLRDMAATDTLTAYDEDGNVLWEVGFALGDHAMSFVSSIAIDSEGRILVGGSLGVAPKVCRLIPNGATYVFDDVNFGGGGLSGCSRLSIVNGVVHDITFDSQDRIVVAGQQTTVSLPAAVWVLINDGVNDGMLDASFDSDGEYIYTPLTGVIGYAVETLFDGTNERIYVAADRGVTDGAVVLEIIDDDPPNAPTANASSDAVANGGAWGIRVLDDGDLLIAGYRETFPEVAYSWLFSDFASPFTYAPGGGFTVSDVRALDVDCHERALLTGRIDDGAEDQMMVMRSDETFVAVDADFADVGWFVDTTVDGSFGQAITRDSLGRLIIGGYVDTPVTQNPRLWRMK